MKDGEEKWGWLYACLIGSGELLFQVKEKDRDAILRGERPATFPYRNMTTLKIRDETPEETRARLKRKGPGPQGTDLVIETLQWLMIKEGVVKPEGTMSGHTISWANPLTDEICQAADRTWSGSKILIAKESSVPNLR